MEGDSGTIRSPRRATEDATVDNEVYQPIKGVSLPSRTLEEGKVSEYTDQGINTESHHLTYFCTFCDDYEDKNLSHWQAHEYRVHQESRHQKCPECSALEYDDTQFTLYGQLSCQKRPKFCPENSDATNEHCQETCKHTAAFDNKSYRQNFWGCGFCYDERTTPMHSWPERCTHVASHMQNGKRRDDWTFTNLIRVLLRQPKVSELWTSYIHTLHGPYAKDHPKFHWVGTNGLCQKILRELEIGLHSVDGQIQLVKMAYIMGANESTHPIESLFSTNQSSGSLDQNMESSCSSPESDTVSENETEGASVTGVKTERSSQCKSSTKMDDRKCPKTSSSLRHIVSIRLLIKKFRQLLPRESAKAKEIKTVAAPGFRNFDDYRTHADVDSALLKDRNSNGSGTLAVACMGAVAGSFIIPERSVNITTTSVERKCTKQKLPSGTLSAIEPCVPAGKERDSLNLNSSRDEKKLQEKTQDQDNLRKYCARRKSRSDSSETRVGIASAHTLPTLYDAPLNYATSTSSAAPPSLARYSSTNRKADRGDHSDSVTVESSQDQKRRKNHFPRLKLVERDNYTPVSTRDTAQINLPTQFSPSPAVSVLLGGEVDQDEEYNVLLDNYSLPPLYSLQQQDNTIYPAILPVTDANANLDGSIGSAVVTESIGVADNRQNFYCEGLGYNLPQSSAIVDQTSLAPSQPLTMGKPLQNNTLSPSCSSIFESSLVPMLDSSSLANSETPTRMMVQTYAMDEPLHNNSSTPSKKRCSSAIGSSLLGVPGSSSGANLRSNKSAFSKETSSVNLKKRQRTSLDASDDDEDKLMLACPYYLRHPKKYMKERSCPGPGWPNVSRLKAHLYSCHKRPVQCSRCSQCFKSKIELNSHQRIAEACQKMPLSIADGMSEEQEDEVKCKARAKTEEDKWRRIWKILFPTDAEADIPKPYYPIPGPFGAQTASSTRLSSDCDFEEFLSRGFHNKVTRKIEMAVEKEDDHIEDKIKKHMVNIVHECTTELFQEFRHWKHGNVSNKISEVTPGLKDSTPTLSTGLSSDGGVLTGKKTPIQSPQRGQDESAGGDCLQDLNLDAFTYAECWPETLEIYPEWSLVADFAEIPVLSMAGPEEGEPPTMSKLEGKQRMNYRNPDRS